MKSLETGIDNTFLSPVREIQEDDLIRFVYRENGNKVGTVRATMIGEKKYNIGGFFVDPQRRGEGIASVLIKSINAFLEREKAIGILVNMASGNSSNLYESNGWKKGEYKSDSQHGGYEFTYDAREKNTTSYPKIGYCYKAFMIKDGNKVERNVIYRGIENGKMIVFDGENEYTTEIHNCENEEIEFVIGDLINNELI